MKCCIPLFIGTCITLFSGCGKKQRTVFDFQTNQVEKFNHLALPAVRNVVVQKKSTANLISWNPLAPEQSLELVGYHVYRLSRPGCVEKKPLTHKPIKECSYVDQAPLPAHAYLVRGVFIYNKKILVGTASKIAHTCKK